MAIYSDDFNRADSTNLGSNWTELDDDWSIKSNQLAPGISTTGIVLYNRPLDTTDQYAQITMTVTTGTSMGIFARSDINKSAFYLLRSNGTDWTLFRNIGGSFTSLGSYTANLAVGDVARIECIGTTIKGYVNGIERISVTDTQITTGNYAGVRSAQSSTARFDNFVTADTGPIGSADLGAFFEVM
jgi:hypothetical protein